MTVVRSLKTPNQERNDNGKRSERVESKHARDRIRGKTVSNLEATRVGKNWEDDLDAMVAKVS